MQIDQFKNEQKLIRSTVKQIDTLLKLNKELTIAYLQEDVDRRLNDKDKNDRYNQWLKNLSKDIYLDQAVKVIGDIQNQRNLAKSPLNKEKPVKSF